MATVEDGVSAGRPTVAERAPDVEGGRYVGERSGTTPSPPAALVMVAEPIAEPLPSGLTDAVFARIPEAALHSAWASGRFVGRDLRTTEGETVRVLAPGRLNRDSGPDFTDARVAIDGVLWAGDVEIHRTSGEWEAHGHHEDPAYRRVVLHAVLSADRRTGTLTRDDGTALPELVLMPHLDRTLRAVVRAHHTEPREAPMCAARWAEVCPDEVAAWVRTRGHARLRSVTAHLSHHYGRTPDLDRLLAGRMFRALGYEPNADAMETLASRLPLDRLRRLDDPTNVLAAVLGAAGWLDAPSFLDADGLPERFLLVDGGILPMDRAAWRTGGRPANAPRVRLAQAAALLAPGGALHADAVPALAEALTHGPADVLDRLRTPPADDSPRLGLDRARAVLVNAVLPVLALDAELRGDIELDERVVAALDVLPAASDRVTRRFAEAGFAPRSALDAHGLHGLARDFCDEGRCAQCAIGQRLYPALARLSAASA